MGVNKLDLEGATKVIKDALDKGWISQEFLDYLDKIGYFEAPGSLNYHNNFSGGLICHCYNVYKVLTTDLNSCCHFSNERSAFIVGMFHDICKADDYCRNPESYEEGAPEWIYNENQLIKGHGDKSVMMLSQFINLTEEEMLCIRYHMGAYKKEDWDQFDRAIRRFPTVLYTHTADMLASKILED